MLGGYMENDAAANAYAGLPVQGQNGATAADVTAGRALGTAFLGQNGSILMAIEHAASSTTYTAGKGIDITGQAVGLDFEADGAATELPALSLASTSVLAGSGGGVMGKFTESDLAEMLAGTVASTGIAASAGVLAIAGDGSSVQLNGSGLIEVKDNGVSLAKMAGITRGSIISGDASGDPQYLAVGSANQFLQSDGTDLAYVSLSGDATLAAGALTISDNAVSLAKMAGVVRGSIISGDASGDPQYLAVGSANQFLQSDGTDLAYVSMSGDATLAAGVLSIGAGKVDHAMLNADVSTSGFTFTSQPVKFDTDILRIKGSDAAGNADQAFSLKVEGGILVLTDQGNF